MADEQELLPEPDLEDDEGEGEDGEGVWEEEGDVSKALGLVIRPRALLPG